MPAPLASDYALPAFAQLSPQDEVTFAAALSVSAQEWRFVADGDFVYVVVAVSVAITTGAAAGNRSYTISHLDASGNQISEVPPAAVQGPGLSIVYTASAQVSALASVGTAQLTPLPVIPLQAGMALSFFLSQRQAGDTFPAPFLTALRYSTEPPPYRAPLTLAPAPLVA